MYSHNNTVGEIAFEVVFGAVSVAGPSFNVCRVLISVGKADLALGTGNCIFKATYHMYTHSVQDIRNGDLNSCTITETYKP